MKKDMTNFIKVSFKLGKELLGKDTLSKKEEDFIECLSIICDKYLRGV